MPRGELFIAVVFLDSFTTISGHVQPQGHWSGAGWHHRDRRAGSVITAPSPAPPAVHQRHPHRWVVPFCSSPAWPCCSARCVSSLGRSPATLHQLDDTRCLPCMQRGVCVCACRRPGGLPGLLPALHVRAAAARVRRLRPWCANTPGELASLVLTPLCWPLLVSANGPECCPRPALLACSNPASIP
jgi:hypothetical protein